LPFIKQKFPTYNSFGEATLSDIYGIKNLGAALNYRATNFASCYMENMGNTRFELRPLPTEAQISSVNGIISDDLDGDGKLDLLLGGNLFGSEAETPRNDASIGLFLKGDGKGGFTPVPAIESGLYMGGDVKDICPIRLGNSGSPGNNGIVSARNSGRVQLHQVNWN
ncbi:MAG: hypothetical protein KAT15_24730, partial [Bacteroidales bacterium]|nr:hypothetical protein [Bacteroidales bacterium]